MLNTTLPPMRPELVVCPNSQCGASGRSGVHSIKERRYRCHACGTTFAETTGTPLFGLKHPLWLVLLILALLSHGCPVPAIVFAFGLDERTVADWQSKAGGHARQVHQQLVCQGQLDLGQVQADELYTKTQAGPVWIAMAMTVFSRLWLWGAISWERDTALIAPVIEQVRAAAQPNRPLLFAVDGFKAYVSCIVQVFRDPQRTGKRGRPRLLVWADLHIVQVVKHRVGRRRLGITRQLAHGSLETAEAIMQATQVEQGCINTAYIERLNATLRTWMPALVRRTRTPSGARERLEAALFWTGCVYNFCHVHATLAGTPAMAADLTDHVWSIEELIRYRCQRE
jgi:transposase-like protein/IS1 family transposase